MLKRIIAFLKTQVIARQQTPNLFAHRFGVDDSLAEQRQWNGGRYLSTKELQNFNKEPNTKLTVQHVS
jgi:hypothetical protein